MNNFFSLVLFSAVIHTRRRMKLMSKIIKYKLDSSSRMQFAFLYPKDIKKKENLGNYRFYQKYESGANRRGGASCSLHDYDACVRKSIRTQELLIGDSRFLIQNLFNQLLSYTDIKES